MSHGGRVPGRMHARRRVHVVALSLWPALGFASCGLALAAPPAESSDIPAQFAPPARPAEFLKREAMIAMRDGVKLHTVIVIPNGVTNAPLLLDRLPYSATHYTGLATDGRLATSLPPLYADLARAGYIVVLQDVRGKHGSEGAYVLTRPRVGPFNPTATDHGTDAYDTIDWLVANVPESNGRVGAIGVSYGGFTALMTALDPHPALRAAVPIDPMVDGWIGDDWFHRGAFRQTLMEYLYWQTTTKDSRLRWPERSRDSYTAWLEAGSALGMARRVGIDRLPALLRLVEHPAYDDYWRSQAVDRMYAGRAPRVPMLLVHSRWDQDDIYGALAMHAALAPHDPTHERVFLAMGPWTHADAVLGDGAITGPLRFGEPTAAWFRSHVLIPFLDRALKGDVRAPAIAPVTAFETGTNVWRTYDRWPCSCAAGCEATSRRLYVRAGARLSFEPPATGEAPFSEYVSDPAKPVPFRARPILASRAPGSDYARWLTDDQRFASDRTDVLTFRSEPLAAPLRLAGAPIAHLVASTSGTDADWVVKLIDQYPEEVPERPEMGGYQLPIAMDVLRARYRDDPSRAAPIQSDRALEYVLPLPHVDHVLLPGHRLVVQIQSSWFPLYDRNPQRFVPSIFDARPTDYVRATQRVLHGTRQASYLELPVTP